MDNNTKMVACISFLLSVSFFLSVTFIEQHQRDERLQKLSDDQWCEQKLVEEFPDFPVVTLRNVMNTAQELRGGINARPDLAKIVKWKTGQYPEYFRWFVVHQRNLTQLSMIQITTIMWVSSPPIWMFTILGLIFFYSRNH